MKRYDVLPEYGTVTNIYQVESPEGEYVDADIAQELYDALEIIKDHPNTRYEVEAQIGDWVWGALAKADGEDQ